jgi:hypothetical protein
MFVQRFFYVSAALLCLTLAYQFGATNAKAQSSDRIVDVGRQPDGQAFAVTERGVIFSNPGNCQAWSAVSQLPAGRIPVSIVDGAGGSVGIACSDGSVWMVQGSGASMSVSACSNVFAGQPTPNKETWGEVKSDYR